MRLWDLATSGSMCEIKGSYGSRRTLLYRPERAYASKTKVVECEVSLR
jgi:hypothetical protein